MVASRHEKWLPIGDNCWIFYYYCLQIVTLFEITQDPDLQSSKSRILWNLIDFSKISTNIHMKSPRKFIIWTASLTSQVCWENIYWPIYLLQALKLTIKSNMMKFSTSCLQACQYITSMDKYIPIYLITFTDESKDILL